MANRNIRFEKIYSLFYVIFIGAIGSGLWEVFLRDSLYWAGDFFVKIASSIYDGYFDRLYENVGKKVDILLYLPGIILTSIILTSPYIMYEYMSVRLRNVDAIIDDEECENFEPSKFVKFAFEQYKSHKIRFKLILLFPMFLISVVFLDVFIVAVSNNSAVMEIERRVEIIRPYISDSESHKIISDFRLVNNRVKLQELLDKIEKVADKSNIVLPEISLYGIESYKKLVK